MKISVNKKKVDYLLDNFIQQLIRQSKILSAKYLDRI